MLFNVGSYCLITYLIFFYVVSVLYFCFSDKKKKTEKCQKKNLITVERSVNKNIMVFNEKTSHKVFSVQNNFGSYQNFLFQNQHSKQHKK